MYLSNDHVKVPFNKIPEISTVNLIMAETENLHLYIYLALKM